MSWLPLSFDRESQSGTYLMRMEPGAVTIAHGHPGMEEFLVIEGDLLDSDGTVYGPGDFVSYEAGTRHNSWTEGGCLLAVFRVAMRRRRSVVTTAAQGAASSGALAFARPLQRTYDLRNEKGGVVRRPFSDYPRPG